MTVRPPTIDGEPTPREAMGLERAGREGDLSWWRRPRPVSRHLTAALALTALLAVVTFGGLNFVAGRDLLVQGTEERLAAVGSTRADAVEAGTQRLLGEISAASSDLAVGRALVELSEAFGDLDGTTLTGEQQAELEAWYQERLVDPLNDVGLGPFESQDLVPDSDAAQWVQYHYTVRPPGTPPPADAGDGTTYSAVNASVTDQFRAFSESKGGGDVLLIDDSGVVVYSLEKRNDVGTDLVTGPYSQSDLARVVTEQLLSARVGTTLLTDYSVSATGRPALFAVSAVRDASQVVGALAVEVPAERVNAITSADGGWEAVGLEDGDAYLVNSEMVLQSEPRAWVEDPDGYLELLRAGDDDDQTEADLVELFGSPIGIQVIDTQPVREAIDGNNFRGGASNYFGDSTFSAAGAFSAGGLQLVIVSEMPRSVVLDPLLGYLRWILIVLVLVLPIVTALGIWLSRLLTRPIRPTVEAAEEIVEGNRHPDVDVARRDEFGDLGRRLSTMAASLAAHEAELAEEYERKRQLLLAVLPPQLVDEDGTVTGTGESAEQATVVAVTVVPIDTQLDSDQAGEVLQAVAQLAEQVADEAGLQRVRIAADRSLFVAGMGSPSSGADEALAFADEFRRRVDSDAEVDLDLHVGLSTGDVATGILDTGALTFGAWGEPVRRALALVSLSRADTVLIDDTTASEATPGRWRLDRARDVVRLDDEPTELFTLHLHDESARSSTL